MILKLNSVENEEKTIMHLNQLIFFQMSKTLKRMFAIWMYQRHNTHITITIILKRKDVILIFI